MGVIYEAEDKTCGRTVALKVLPHKLSAPTGDALRFIAEAQITSQLDHPNIVPIHELGMDGYQRVFYTMKYIRGQTLAAVLNGIRRGRRDLIEQYPLARLLDIFQKVCDALAFAHDRGVIHRDVKPDNIMLGDYGEVVLMDWGLAVHAGKVTKRTASRRRKPLKIPVPLRQDGLTDQVLGSPGYMAPEQIGLLGGALSNRTDIYGLGATLYSILTLRPTVAGKNIIQVLKKTVTGDFPAPASLKTASTQGISAHESVAPFPHCPNGVIPRILSDITMRALAADPADRYPSVRSFQEELSTYQNGLIWIPVLDEDFSKPDIEQRWDIIGCTWEWHDGELIIFGGEPQLLLLKKPLRGDVRIEFECRQKSVYLNDVSCFMGAIPTSNVRETPYSGYEFKYGGFDNSLILLSRNQTRLWTKAASPIKQGQVYRVRAERIGAKLRLFVNDHEIFHVEDPDPLAGPDRTAVGLYGWRATTHYSRVRIYSLKAPWRSDLLDFADREVQKGHLSLARSLYREACDTTNDPTRKRYARSGLEFVTRYGNIQRELPRIQAQLKKAWPGRPFHISMDHDGLTLDVSGCRIRDLEPLRGLPIRSLNCRNNAIRSLEPLRGGSLKTIICSDNPIQSLKPLRDMPLTEVICECCCIREMDCLRSLPLQLLSIGGNPLMSLEALRGMPLVNLYAWGTGITSLAPLRDMPLVTLDCYINQLKDLNPLSGMLLSSLNCESNHIRSLEPLRGMPIRSLHCGQNQITSLAPLTGAPLRHLTCACNRIRSLEPLAVNSLDRLVAAENPVTSLEPLRHNPPRIVLYESDSLSSSEIKRAATAWRADPQHIHLLREAETLLALRNRDVSRLRSMAVQHAGKAYLYIPKHLTWKDAKCLCERLGGHLITPQSREEHEFLLSLYPTAWTWLGLYGTSRGLRSVTRQPIPYDCFAFERDRASPGPKIFSRFWSSQNQADYMNPFIIEWDAGRTRP
ncbi:MAG: protein kinase [Kiritimatiellae bacterium]|nr:protein kinase [Kiritimatiellia bacterium]